MATSIFDAGCVLEYSEAQSVVDVDVPIATDEVLPVIVSFNESDLESIAKLPLESSVEPNLSSLVNKNLNVNIVSNKIVPSRKKMPLKFVNKLPTINDVPRELATESSQDSDVIYISKEIGTSRQSLPLQSLLRQEEVIPNVAIDTAKVLKSCWRTFHITFQQAGLQQIVGPVERSVNGQSLKMVLPTTNHAYMYLQHQDDMSCWRHSLCAILGWNIHPEFSSSDWLMACMVTFAEVPEEYKKLLDRDMETITDDKGVVIYDEPIHYDFIPASSQSNSFNDDVDELRVKIQRYSTWLQIKNCRTEGLAKVNLYATLLLLLSIITYVML